MDMAKDMRDLAEKNQHTKAIEWWKNFKPELLNEIRKRAAKGNFELIIYMRDKLNNDGLLESQRLRDIVKTELSHLGYEFAYYNGSYQSDGDDKHITIKW